MCSHGGHQILGILLIVLGVLLIVAVATPLIIFALGLFLIFQGLKLRNQDQVVYTYYYRWSDRFKR